MRQFDSRSYAACAGVAAAAAASFADVVSGCRWTILVDHSALGSAPFALNVQLDEQEEEEEEVS